MNIFSIDMTNIKLLFVGYACRNFMLSGLRHPFLPWTLNQIQISNFIGMHLVIAITKRNKKLARGYFNCPNKQT
jgi:hypothetical protein